MSSLSPLGPAPNAGPFPYRPRPSPSNSLQKLSSGFPINSDAGGAPAPVIPEKLRDSVAAAAQKPNTAAIGGTGTIISFEA